MALINSDKDYHGRLKSVVRSAKSDEELFQAIVDAPFTDKLKAALLGLGIVVLLLVDKKTKTIDRIALSNTEQAKGAAKVSEKPFKSIKIPAGYKGNLIAQAILTGKPQQTTDWQYLFAPALSPEAARFNQAGAGIGWSAVYPLKKVGDGGALIFSYYLVSDDNRRQRKNFMRKYSRIVSQRLSSQNI